MVLSTGFQLVFTVDNSTYAQGEPFMLRRTSLILARLLLILMTLCWGVSLPDAQGNTSTGRPSPYPNAMQTRKTTMAQRRAAAARSPARKAAASEKN